MKRHFFMLFTWLVLALLVAMPASTRLAAVQATMAPTMAGTPTTGFDPAVCFRAATNNDKMVTFKAKPGPYTIGISNSFIGNAWRTQMIQIAAMDNMIAQGVDAIILNAATPEAFGAVIKRATDAGIIVVSFDNIVTAPEAVLVNEDQVEFGRVMAEDLAKRMNGKGNVVLVNGVPGTSVDSDRNKGAKEV